MKDISEYKTVEEIFKDGVEEGLIRWARSFRPDTVLKLKDAILKYITVRRGVINVVGWRMGRALRNNRNIVEYKTAINELIDSKMILEEAQQTGKKGRPAMFYKLYEN